MTLLLEPCTLKTHSSIIKTDQSIQYVTTSVQLQILVTIITVQQIVIHIESFICLIFAILFLTARKHYLRIQIRTSTFYEQAILAFTLLYSGIERSDHTSTTIQPLVRIRHLLQDPLGFTCVIWRTKIHFPLHAKPL